MALITNILVGFMALWCTIYFLVYLHFLAASNDINSTISSPIAPIATLHNIVPNRPLSILKKDNENEKQQDLQNIASSYQYSSILTNPILSYSCNSYITQDKYIIWKQPSVAIILVVTNENRSIILQTISSLLVNSGPMLEGIYIVDNSFNGDVKNWADWHSPSFSSIKLTEVKINHIRTSSHNMRLAACRELAISTIANIKVTTYVFVDTHILVTHDWLYPLLNTLKTHPTSIVYPAIDILTEQDNKVAIIKGDKVVAGFNWNFMKKWIPILEQPQPHQNAEQHIDIDDDDIDEVISPITHSTFAIEAKFYKEIGGLDTTLVSYLPEIELSLRTWLCGGSIIRQPCSRIAQSFPNLRSSVDTQVSQFDFDKNIIAISHRWMSKIYRELVFQARFLDRIPEKPTIALDNLHPVKFTDAKLLNEYNCLSMDWYLKEVDPTLLSEVSTVGTRFSSYITSSYLQGSLLPLLNQYSTKSSQQRRIISSEMSTKLNQYSSKYTDKDVSDKDVAGIKQNYIDDAHFSHQEYIKKTLACEDENFFGCPGCEQFKADGKCETDAMYSMFGCPKSCGLCDSKGKICVDYFVRKCPQMKEQGHCESNKDYMHENCRLSCGLCTRATSTELAAAAAGVVDTSSIVITEKQPNEPAIPQMQLLPEKLHEVVPLATDRFDPYLARQKYLQGNMPDEATPNTCSLNNRPNGDLLSRIIVDSSSNSETGPKIFCGIYTMESNHLTNVKSTMETWGKHCDGFVAFSTKTDESVSAMFIEHEGEESYQNMWQKSRSIWKYIYQHYSNDFDYFLLGGDDMFYIIENLKFYLNSEEIVAEKSKGKGLYIGRKFQPPKQLVFNSGGAGYTLDKIALKQLGEHIDLPMCFPHQKGFWEDVNIANCLLKSNNITPYDTRDSLQRERFHPFTPGQHLTYKIPPNNPDWYKQYNPNLKLGYECCSDRSISFHYVPYALMREMYSYVYHCQNKAIRNNIYP